MFDGRLPGDEAFEQPSADESFQRQPLETATPVTILLTRWRAGDLDALHELTPLIYSELRRIASAKFRRERSGHTLQPTALVNEAFLRLCAGEQNVEWRSRAHFLGIAARVMRQILIQHARSRNAEKRGGGSNVVSLAEAREADHEATDLIEVGEALDRLEAIDQRKACLVDLRFFGGLTVREIAYHEGLSVSTVERETRIALAWLRRELAAQARTNAVDVLIPGGDFDLWLAKHLGEEH